MTINPITVEWTDKTTAVINGGSMLKFTGTIKGFEDIVITYFADTLEEIKDGLDLVVWDYHIEKNE